MYFILFAALIVLVATTPVIDEESIVAEPAFVPDDKFAPDILPRNLLFTDVNTYEIDCTKFPNICQNWCFYRYCKTTGSKTGDQRWIVTVDSKANLRSESECRGKNRCSTRSDLRDKWASNPTAGLSCDEQPKNTNSEGGAGAATRCVPAGENSSEGATWGGYIKSNKLADGALVTVSLKNTTGIGGYCAGLTGGKLTCTAAKSPGTGDSVRQM